MTSRKYVVLFSCKLNSNENHEDEDAMIAHTPNYAVIIAEKNYNPTNTVAELRETAKRWGIKPIPLSRAALMDVLVQALKDAEKWNIQEQETKAKDENKRTVRQPRQVVYETLKTISAITKDHISAQYENAVGLSQLSWQLEKAGLWNEHDMVECMVDPQNMMLRAKRDIQTYAQRVQEYVQQTITRMNANPVGSNLFDMDWAENAIKETSRSAKELQIASQSLAKLFHAAVIMITMNPKAIEVMNTTLKNLTPEIKGTVDEEASIQDVIDFSNVIVPVPELASNPA